MSKTHTLCHIVFATKHRRKTITEASKRDLYSYIYGIIKNHRSFLYRINGCSDHVHILLDLHPTVALATLVRDIKQHSSKWLRGNPQFPMFDSWGEGYYSSSLGLEDLDACKTYIMNQESHHKVTDLIAEMKEWAKVKGFAWHEDDLD